MNFQCIKEVINETRVLHVISPQTRSIWPYLSGVTLSDRWNSPFCKRKQEEEEEEEEEETHLLEPIQNKI
jgi:hypothetical protein